MVHNTSSYDDAADGAGKVASVKKLIRYGSPDTVERLAESAALAEEKIGYHGVSTMLRKPPMGSQGQAESEVASQVFKVIQTGNNRSHYTVILPKPVTQEVADMFNSLFTLIDG